MSRETILDMNNHYTESTNILRSFRSEKEEIDRRVLTVVAICDIITYSIFFAMGVGIILFASYSSNECDYTDPIGINLSGYLLGLGITWTIYMGLHIVLWILILFGCILPALPVACFTLIYIILYKIFTLVWVILGGIVIFRSNLICIQDGHAKAIITLIIWCISALELVLSCCCSSRSSRD